MELDAADIYASAALFTLALHATQREGGRHGFEQPSPDAWGVPLEYILEGRAPAPHSDPFFEQELLSREKASSEKSEAKDKGKEKGKKKGSSAKDAGSDEEEGESSYSPGWGFELCANDGLMRHVYQELGVQPRSVAGLMQMVDPISAAPDSEQALMKLVDAVYNWSTFLDPDLQFTARPPCAVQMAYDRTLSPGLIPQAPTYECTVTPGLDSVGLDSPRNSVVTVKRVPNSSSSSTSAPPSILAGRQSTSFTHKECFTSTSADPAGWNDTAGAASSAYSFGRVVPAGEAASMASSASSPVKMAKRPAEQQEAGGQSGSPVYTNIADAGALPHSAFSMDNYTDPVQQGRENSSGDVVDEAKVSGVGGAFPPAPRWSAAVDAGVNLGLETLQELQGQEEPKVKQVTGGGSSTSGASTAMSVSNVAMYPASEMWLENSTDTVQGSTNSVQPPRSSQPLPPDCSSARSNTSAGNTPASSVANPKNVFHVAASSLPLIGEDGEPEDEEDESVQPISTFNPPNQYRHMHSHKSALAVYSIIGACMHIPGDEPKSDSEGGAGGAEDTASVTSSSQSATAGGKGGGSTDSHFSSWLSLGSTKSKTKAKEPATADAATQARDTTKGKSGGAPSGVSWYSFSSSQASTDKGARQGKGAAGSELQVVGGGRKDMRAEEEKLMQPFQLYDARSRIAIKRMCHWLRVPWPQMCAFEQLWLSDVLMKQQLKEKARAEAYAEAAEEEGVVAVSSRKSLKRQLKVGGAVLGGAALLAITGGLLAPALVAGAGAAMAAAHFGGAAAVATFSATTASTVSVAGAGAVMGGAHAGTMQAEQLRGVKEFGFWDLSWSTVWLPLASGTSTRATSQAGTEDVCKKGSEVEPGDGGHQGDQGTGRTGVSGWKPEVRLHRGGTILARRALSTDGGPLGNYSTHSAASAMPRLGVKDGLVSACYTDLDNLGLQRKPYDLLPLLCDLKRDEGYTGSKACGDSSPPPPPSPYAAADVPAHSKDPQVPQSTAQVDFPPPLFPPSTSTLPTPTLPPSTSQVVSPPFPGPGAPSGADHNPSPVLISPFAPTSLALPSQQGSSTLAATFPADKLNPSSPHEAPPPQQGVDHTIGFHSLAAVTSAQKACLATDAARGLSHPVLEPPAGASNSPKVLEGESGGLPPLGRAQQARSNTVEGAGVGLAPAQGAEGSSGRPAVPKEAGEKSDACPPGEKAQALNRAHFTFSASGQRLSVGVGEDALKPVADGAQPTPLSAHGECDEDMLMRVYGSQWEGRLQPGHAMENQMRFHTSRQGSAPCPPAADATTSSLRELEVMAMKEMSHYTSPHGPSRYPSGRLTRSLSQASLGSLGSLNMFTLPDLEDMDGDERVLSSFMALQGRSTLGDGHWPPSELSHRSSYSSTQVDHHLTRNLSMRSRANHARCVSEGLRPMLQCPSSSLHTSVGGAATGADCPGGGAGGGPALSAGGQTGATILADAAGASRTAGQEGAKAGGATDKKSSSYWPWGSSSSSTKKPTSANKPAPVPSAPSNTSYMRVFRKVPIPELRPMLPLPLNPARMVDAAPALTIAVNGWISEPDDFVLPWRGLPSKGCDRFALKWESEVLISLGGALGRCMRNAVIVNSGKLLIGGLMAAVAIPWSIMNLMSMTIGSRWALALKRAKLAGRLLAQVLAAGGHCGRPVTLIGFSMGARLLFHCLLELDRLGKRGIVESVILLGAPVSINPARWKQARSVVAGRFVNAYSTNDWILGLVYRCHSRAAMANRAGGLAPANVPGVENINFSRYIKGHTDYLTRMDDLLELLNLSMDG